MTPTRPVLRWHGGKWMLAPWIIDHFPPHRVYTEAYGGAASVLLRKPRAYAEVYNDLDGEVVNLFRVLQDRAARARLHELLRMTPFARAEFLICRRKVVDRVERARRLIMRSGMGFGSNSHNMALSTGFRVSVRKTGANVAQDWAKYPDAIESFAERFRGVTIESRPALQVIQQHDGSSTLHYVDPPYVHGTRAPGRRQHDYVHEMTDADHRALAAVLSTVRGGGSPLRVSVAPLRGAVRGLAPRRAGGPGGRRAQADRGPLDQRRGLERRREAFVRRDYGMVIMAAEDSPQKGHRTMCSPWSASLIIPWSIFPQLGQVARYAIIGTSSASFLSSSMTAILSTSAARKGYPQS